MEISKKIAIINGSVKHYDWGGKTFLPQLLNDANSDNNSYAEYWLGNSLPQTFGKLPFLFKVLDVEKMLSIQVHPSKEVAENKFKEENEKGIPLDASHRNYKDDNHKPELLSPINDFYLLHGFKPENEIKKTLEEIPELHFLKEYFGDGNYKKLYSAVMTLPQQEVNKRLQPLLDRIIPKYNGGEIKKTSPDFWAARAALNFNKNENVDRGIFSIYLFNLVKMTRGEGLFQDAGLPHAYLEGQTMEIMANSDNVLRGGLTPKHIDVKELLERIKFQPTTPAIIKVAISEDETGSQTFNTIADDFELSRIIVKKGKGIAIPALKIDIYFVLTGSLTATADEEQLTLSAGMALLATPGAVVHFAAIDDAVIYRAAEPIVQKQE